MTTFDDLERRATVLERAQSANATTLRWVTGTLGQIQAVQDEHTQRLDRIESRFDGIESKVDKLVDRLEAKVNGLLETLPSIVGEAVRIAVKPPGTN
jgi:hypothetical protein